MNAKNILRNIEPAYSILNDSGITLGVVIPQLENIRYISEKTMKNKLSGKNSHYFELYSYKAEEEKMALSLLERKNMFPEDHLAILIKDILEGIR